MSASYENYSSKQLKGPETGILGSLVMDGSVLSLLIVLSFWVIFSRKLSENHMLGIVNNLSYNISVFLMLA